MFRRNKIPKISCQNVQGNFTGKNLVLQILHSIALYTIYIYIKHFINLIKTLSTSLNSNHFKIRRLKLLEKFKEYIKVCRHIYKCYI